MQIVLITNIMTPYRKYFYDLMYGECKRNNIEFKVILMTETEPNRNWDYNDLKTSYTELLPSYTISMSEIYIHFNWGLERLLDSLDPEIVICAGSYLSPTLWNVFRLKRKYGYKLIYWSESHLNEVRNYSHFKIKFRELLRNKVYKKFDGFWYAGKLSKEFIEKYSNANSNYFFMPNLINENNYLNIINHSENYKESLKNRYSISKNKLIFFCPARLSKVKGIMEFIELLSKSKFKDKITVLIAGEGELFQEISTKSIFHNLDIRLLGFKKPSEITDLYSISDVFLMPSLSDPNPLTCIEALWCGLPLLVTNHVGNYPEAVIEGVNGFVINYSDVDESIEKINKIINSDKKWFENASDESIKIAKNYYSSKDKVSETVLSLMKMVNN